MSNGTTLGNFSLFNQQPGGVGSGINLSNTLLSNPPTNIGVGSGLQLPSFNINNSAQTLNNQMNAGSSSNLGIGGNAMTAIASSLPMVAGLVAGGKDRKKANDANDKAMQLATDIENFKRQTPNNPFAGITNYASNLAVATQAAEIKAREADQSLANTLDTIRATGLGAGGATALAQAAAKAKQGVTADIEKQEAANQSLMAKGEADRQMMIGKGEQARQQMVAAQEADRMNVMADLAGMYMAQGQQAQAAAQGKGQAGLALGMQAGKFLLDNPETASKIGDAVSGLFK